MSTCGSNTSGPRCPTRCMCHFEASDRVPLTSEHQAAKGAIDSHDAIVGLLESIENFLKRLDIYTKVPPTPAMDEIVVKILVELISTLALATKELKQGRPSESILANVLSYSAPLREIRQKSFWRRQRCRSGPPEARSTHPGGGSHDCSGDSQYRSWSCTGYE